MPASAEFDEIAEASEAPVGGAECAEIGAAAVHDAKATALAGRPLAYADHSEESPHPVGQMKTMVRVAVEVAVDPTFVAAERDMHRKPEAHRLTSTG